MVRSEHLSYVLVNYHNHNPFLIWASSQNFILCTFSVVEYCQEFLSCEIFCQCHFLCDIFIHSVTIVSFILINLPYCSVSCISRSLEWWQWQSRGQLLLSSINPIRLFWFSLPVLWFFFLCYTFIFAHPLSLPIPFGKMSMVYHWDTRK